MLTSSVLQSTTVQTLQPPWTGSYVCVGGAAASIDSSGDRPRRTTILALSPKEQAVFPTSPSRCCLPFGMLSGKLLVITRLMWAVRCTMEPVAIRLADCLSGVASTRVVPLHRFRGSLSRSSSRVRRYRWERQPPSPRPVPRCGRQRLQTGQFFPA